MEFDSHKAFGHVRHLADEIGGRLVGSPAAERAAAYVAGQFAAAGLRVAEQEFSVHYAAVASHEIEVLEPPLGVIASSPVLLSADTPEDGLTGELLLVEGGDAAAIGPHLAGRIVLWMIASRADFQTRLEAVAAQRVILENIFNIFNVRKFLYFKY